MHVHNLGRAFHYLSISLVRQNHPLPLLNLLSHIFTMITTWPCTPIWLQVRLYTSKHQTCSHMHDNIHSVHSITFLILHLCRNPHACTFPFCYSPIIPENHSFLVHAVCFIPISRFVQTISGAPIHLCRFHSLVAARAHAFWLNKPHACRPCPCHASTTSETHHSIWFMLSHLS